MTDKEVRRKSDYVLVPSPEATQILIDELRSRLSATEARLEAVKAKAEEWRSFQPGAFYPEASAYANAIESCGDALIDLLDEPAAALSVAPNEAP